MGNWDEKKCIQTYVTQDLRQKRLPLATVVFMCIVSLPAFVIGKERGAVLVILMAEVQVGILWISDLCGEVLPLQAFF